MLLSELHRYHTLPDSTESTRAEAGRRTDLEEEGEEETHEREFFVPRMKKDFRRFKKCKRLRLPSSFAPSLDS